jgi:hypothetical protein
LEGAQIQATKRNLISKDNFIVSIIDLAQEQVMFYHTALDS